MSTTPDLADAQHALDPVPEERRASTAMHQFWIWMGANIAPINWVLGALGIYLGLSLWQTIGVLVVGENRTFEASEDWLRANGVEVVVLDLPECKELMDEFIAAEPALWNEDIGVEDAS